MPGQPVTLVHAMYHDVEGQCYSASSINAAQYHAPTVPHTTQVGNLGPQGGQ